MPSREGIISPDGRLSGSVLAGGGESFWIMCSFRKEPKGNVLSVASLYESGKAERILWEVKDCLLIYNN